VVSLEADCLDNPQKCRCIDVQLPGTAAQAQKNVGSRFIQDAPDYFSPLRRNPNDKQSRSGARQTRINFGAHSSLTRDPQPPLPYFSTCRTPIITPNTQVWRRGAH